MTPKTETERIETCKNIFVTHRDISKIMDQTSQKTADMVFKRLEPEIKNIHKGLENGEKRFSKQDEKIEAIVLNCAKQHGEYHYPTRSDGMSYKVPIDKLNDENDEYITANGIRKKVAIIIAIVTGVFTVLGFLIFGIFKLIQALPFLIIMLYFVL